ncbi:hypothetical protein [Comamonas badia]|uniref:hypothetical protein n=1 Tax=Comamonas badia TaxID=265291 RepID=UPI0012EB7DD2|nr:hypothetical protein [Comamonas badia]
MQAHTNGSSSSALLPHCDRTWGREGFELALETRMDTWFQLSCGENYQQNTNKTKSAPFAAGVAFMLTFIPAPSR